MSVVHICTTDSFRAGCEQFPPVECWLCGNVTAYISWCDCRCDTCGADQSETAWSIRTARHKTGLTRKQWAAKARLKPVTISSYDYYPSKPYIKWAKEFVTQFYNGANQ